MSTTHIELRTIHWDILKLIRTLCYEGLPETRLACVDPDDRRLPLWKPNPHDGRFVLPDGVPEPLVNACLFAVPLDESRRRWGQDGHGSDPTLRYLIDRGLLGTSDDNWPICAAFRNYFNDAEILLTVRIEVNENGRFYVWQTPTVMSLLHERGASLETSTPYRVFKLTERAHELLDAERTVAEPVTGGNDPTMPDATGYVASPSDSSAYVPMATIRAEYCSGIFLSSMKEIIKVLEDFPIHCVRWTRPPSKTTGVPHPQRRSVHLVDWQRNVDRLKSGRPATAKKGFPDLSPSEIEAGKASARRNRRNGK